MDRRETQTDTAVDEGGVSAAGGSFTRTEGNLSGRTSSSSAPLARFSWIGAAVAFGTMLTALFALSLPPVVRVEPFEGSLEVSRDTVIRVRLAAPYLSPGLDPASIDESTVLLYPAGRRAQRVPLEFRMEEGGAGFVVQPRARLEANAPYIVEITEGVTDLNGRRLASHRTSFRTGATPYGKLKGVHFEQTALPGTTGPFTTLAVGPDGRLYGAQLDGLIKRWKIAPDGTLYDLEMLNGVKIAEGGYRLLVGLAFDPASTPDSLIAWVTHSTFGLSGMPDWGGKLTRLSGPRLEEAQDFVVNLPRSTRDHVTNGIAFGPDGALYVGQGGNTSLGAPEPAWGNRPERLLSAAVLRIDVEEIWTRGDLPLDVKTAEGGTYDPFAPEAPVTILASGIRNPYDLVWHSNGYLYAANNGAAPGGGTPASVEGTLRPDRSPYVGPRVPGVSDLGVRDDFLFRVPPGMAEGAPRHHYFGHPNPTRGEYVLDGGNPTPLLDPGEVTQYPVGVEPDAAWAGFVYNFGAHASPTGMLEYRAESFGGVLAGHLIVALYSQQGGGNVVALRPDSNGRIDADRDNLEISGMTGLENPLDLAENPTTGDIYVSEYRGSSGIVLLRPAQEPSLIASGRAE